MASVSEAGTAVCALAFEPQHATEPFARRAMLWISPAETCTTPVRPAGTFDCWKVLEPHAITAPEARTASE